MKKNTFLLIFVCFLFYQSIYSQCTDTHNSGSNSTSAGSYGQSFEPTCSGALNTIGVVTVSAESNLTVTLYDGEGTGGTVLATLSSQSISASSSVTDFKTFDFSGEGVSLTAGNRYTFIVAGDTHQFIFDNSATYNNGQLYFGGSPQATLDLNFEVNIIIPSDTTPPIFENSTPNVSSIEATSFNLNTDIDEAGDIFYVVLTDGATAPTSTDVVNGTGNAGSGVETSGNATVSSGGFTNAFTITGLSESTDYDVYVVARDDEGTPNLQSSPTLVNVTTGTNTIIWDGSENNDWATAANWNTNAIPVSSSNVQIPSGLSSYPTIADGSNIIVNTVTIASGASLIADGSATLIGTVTYNRNLATTNWYLVSSPVSGETYDNDYVSANSLDINGSNNAIALYVPFSDTWSFMQTGNSASFVNGRGYSVKRDDTAGAGNISFTGSFNDADDSVTTVIVGNRFNLIGNPYTSYLNGATLLTNESSALESQTAWFWNQGTSSYDTKTPGADPNFKVAPAQGFFVQRTSSGTDTIDFLESMQSHESSDTFQKGLSRPEIHLFLAYDNTYRKTRIIYDDNTTIGFDNGYDGKLFGGVSNTFQLFSNLLSGDDNGKYAVQVIPNKNYENKVIPIGLKVNAGKEITFTADVLNLPSGLKIFLEDRETNTFKRLDEANASYKLTLNNALEGSGRFFLHTRSSALSTDDASLMGVGIYTVNKNTLRISGVNSSDASVKVYNILGRKVVDQNFSSKNVYDVSLPKLNTGVYIVQLSTEKGKMNKKIVLE